MNYFTKYMEKKLYYLDEFGGSQVEESLQVFNFEK